MNREVFQKIQSAFFKVDLHKRNTYFSYLHYFLSCINLTFVPDAPLLIHIHGGYYQEECITHSNNGFIANILHENGIKTILLGYELSPQRTVREILEHLQIGLKECMSYATKMKSR